MFVKVHFMFVYEIEPLNLRLKNIASIFLWHVRILNDKYIILGINKPLF